VQRRSCPFFKAFASLRWASDGDTPLISKELDMGHCSDEIRTYPPPLVLHSQGRAQCLAGGQSGGPVGGQSYPKSVSGLLAFDPLFFLNVEPGWKPPFVGDKNVFEVSKRIDFRPQCLMHRAWASTSTMGGSGPLIIRRKGSLSFTSDGRYPTQRGDPVSFEFILAVGPGHYWMHELRRAISAGT